MVVCLPKARILRVVIVDVAHHVTQSGNGRQFTLADDAERWVYRGLAGTAAGTRRLHPSPRSTHPAPLDTKRGRSSAENRGWTKHGRF
jgi:hypothetical protein